MGIVGWMGGLRRGDGSGWGGGGPGWFGRGGGAFQDAHLRMDVHQHIVLVNTNQLRAQSPIRTRVSLTAAMEGVLE